MGFSMPSFGGRSHINSASDQLGAKALGSELIYFVESLLIHPRAGVQLRDRFGRRRLSRHVFGRCESHVGILVHTNLVTPGVAIGGSGSFAAQSYCGGLRSSFEL